MALNGFILSWVECRFKELSSHQRP